MFVKFNAVESFSKADEYNMKRFVELFMSMDFSISWQRQKNCLVVPRPG